MAKRVLDKALGPLPVGFGFGVAAVDPETGRRGLLGTDGLSRESWCLTLTGKAFKMCFLDWKVTMMHSVPFLKMWELTATHFL